MQYYSVRGTAAEAVRGKRGYQALTEPRTGIGTRAWLGSIVQNGRFSAGTFMRHMRLKNDDLPMFGRPTMPSFTNAFPVCW